jgi:hypothetical protein
MAHWLDPLKPERVGHVAAAMILLALQGLAIIWSLVNPVFL